MSLQPLRGALPALPTPFVPDGSAIDEAGLRRLVDFIIESGADGMVVAGGTGEFNALTNSERRQVVEIVTQHAAGRANVVAHTGGLTTQEAVDHTAHAAQHGVDAVMVGLPFYEPLNTHQILEYFKAVAAASALPVMPYNFPAATQVRFDVALMEHLSEAVPAVSYLKDSGGDLLATHLHAMHFGDRLPVFCGFDWQSGPALLMGAAGVVNGAANVFPAEFARMCAAAFEGDRATVISIWLTLLPFLRFYMDHPFNSTTKHACRIVGVPIESVVRAPGEDLDPAGISELERLIKTIREA